MGALTELRDLAIGLRSGDYPSFVTRGKIKGEVPVFLYHKVDPVQMDAHYKYLNLNGYRTYFANEHFEALTSRTPVVERGMVVTFDDGLADLYQLAFPLLKKHQIKAIAFIIPSRVGLPGMVTWSQIKEMHESGLVDIQSHSMHHAAVPTSSNIVDYFRPGFHYYCPWDIPMPSGWVSGVPSFPPPLGTPILEHTSRLTDARRYILPPGFENRFTKPVEECGGEEFFKRRTWQNVLNNEALSGAATETGRMESIEEQEAAIRAELVDSKQRIEEELPGKQVMHLAYPWNLVGSITKKLLPDCGYQSAYAGLTRYRGPVNAEMGIYELARISGDFIPCLPGEGRKSLLSVLGFKIARRIMSGRPY